MLCGVDRTCPIRTTALIALEEYASMTALPCRSILRSLACTAFALAAHDMWDADSK